MDRAAPVASSVSRAPCHRDATIVPGDQELLHRFLAGSGEPAEAAFAVLVERYAPIVHRVCVDVVGCSHEAQDATQAVFLVLARRARSIRRPESLGPWLHGVAIRVARRCLRERARRRVVERKKAEMMQERDTTNSGPEIMDHAALHAEINRLPEKYRQPVILCYLQGQTQTEAARTLGWPLGTVQIRLHRGRERLRSRLNRQGAGLIAIAAPNLTLAHTIPPRVPADEWTTTTARAAVRFAAGKETASLIASPVARLAESVLSGMLSDSLMIVTSTMTLFLFASAALFFVVDSRSIARTERSSGVSGSASPPLMKPAQALAAPIRKLPDAIVKEGELVADPATPLKVKPRLLGRQASRLDPTIASMPHPGDQPAKEGVPDSSLPSPGQSSSLARLRRPPGTTSIDGRELFERVWVKNDPRSHGGDGLGPVFNGQSCVACHNLAGTGGAGALDKNIEIVSASDTLGDGTGYFYSFSMDFGAGRFEYKIGGDPAANSRRRTQADTALLAGIHPGFRDADSTVLHQFGTDPAYQGWRGSVPGRHGSILIRTSQRNPPSLFGTGLIDSIPDTAIEAAARRKPSGPAPVKGRVSRLKDGRIGRFGWKAQTATLAEFVRSAAANEIGLEVPRHHQAADPRLPGIAPAGMDMDDGECDALVDYVRRLRMPSPIEPDDVIAAPPLKTGETTFKSIGCASCHMPKLGNVEGIYSDLLLHDMGPQLADSDTYSVFVAEPAQAGGPAAPARVRAEASGASLREWRTPPLWGVRHSSPYLHDGRAATIVEAIMLHAGQGATSARRFTELSARRKQQLEAFLMSLPAPAGNRGRTP